MYLTYRSYLYQQEQLESSATSEQQGRQVANSDQQGQVLFFVICTILHPPIVVGYDANNYLI